MSKAIMNLVIPNKQICKIMGIQASLSEKKSSQIIFGYFHLMTIIMMSIKLITERSKNPPLKMKLITCKANEFVFFPIIPMLTSAAIMIS